ncbi:penicillin-binding protein activator, partial [bacterium]|nr:penicillin-binding protein activator [bacterium]
VVAFTNEFPTNPLTPKLQNVLDQASVSTDATVKIGVILPLKAGYATDGMAILNGIRYAKQEYESTHATTVELIIRDSGSNVVTAVKAARELVADPDIVVIIGELESGITAAIGTAIANSGVPLVAPVASQHGLASLGENIFQANADWYHRGRKIAEYAINVMNLHTFASIAPADQYGKEMVEGFTATVQELGGELIVEPKWYYQGSKDLSRQLKDIREKGLELLKNDPEWVLKNSMLLAEAVKDTFIVPITSIDGLFCPVYTEDIQYVGAQCASLNLRMQMLGGDYWYAPDVLRNSQKYVNGVVFVSDYFVDEFSADYRLFVADFRQKMRTDFGHMQAFGYDVMKVMLGLTNGTSPDRSEFSRQLNNIDGFPGLKNRITWRNHDRVNTEVNIVNYQNGKFQKLK